MPWVFAKCVPEQPSSAARVFMRSTKALIEPEMCSAMMLHASFADASAAQYRRSRRLIVSPRSIYAVELSCSRPVLHAAEAVTISSGEAVPASIASTASSSVIIFVRLAGSRREYASILKSILPLPISPSSAHCALLSFGAPSSSAKAQGSAMPSTRLRHRVSAVMRSFIIIYSPQLPFIPYIIDIFCCRRKR